MGKNLGHFGEDDPNHPWREPKIIVGVWRPPARKPTPLAEPKSGKDVLPKA